MMAACFVRFQSTHSLRSATICNHCKKSGCSGFNPRTPCGVRLLPQKNFFGFSCFNPRTPCGVRLVKRYHAGFLSPFQSTHSLRSATGSGIGSRRRGDVSIHALLAECDRLRFPRALNKLGFNPRTPCGVRPTCLSTTPPVKGFNPRTPCGVRPTSFPRSSPHS